MLKEKLRFRENEIPMTSLMYWNVKEAREFLILNGYVFTLRKPRKEGPAIAVVGSYYDHHPIGSTFVKLIKEDIQHAHELSAYVAGSGIKAQITLNDMCYDDDAHHWFRLAYQLSVKEEGQKLNLYLVTMDMTGMYKIPPQKEGPIEKVLNHTSMPSEELFR